MMLWCSSIRFLLVILGLAFGHLGDSSGDAHSRADTTRLVLFVDRLSACWCEVSTSFGPLLTPAASCCSGCGDAGVGLIRRGLVRNIGAKFTG